MATNSVPKTTRLAGHWISSAQERPPTFRPKKLDIEKPKAKTRKEEGIGRHAARSYTYAPTSTHTRLRNNDPTTTNALSRSHQTWQFLTHPVVCVQAEFPHRVRPRSRYQLAPEKRPLPPLPYQPVPTTAHCGARLRLAAHY